MIYKKIRLFFLLWIITICAIGLYLWQFEDYNANIGILPLVAVYTSDYWLLLFFWLLALTLMLPVNVSNPSNIFLCIYLIGACLWLASYWSATGLLNLSQAILLAVLVMLPAIIVQLAQWFVPHFPLHVRSGNKIGLPNSWMLPVLCGLLLCSAILGYSTGGHEGSFDYGDGHLRRLSGRYSFADNNLAAYAMQMSMNGLAPLLAFLGVYKKTRLALIFAFGFAVFSYWLLATKSPFLSITLLALLGYALSRRSVKQFTAWLISALVLLMLFALIELWICDLSMLADYGIRRIALVSANIQTYFMDAMERQGWGAVMLYGLNFEGFSSPEFFVGSTYMGNELTNANTNAYLHQMAIGGGAGYLMVIIFTGVFTFTLDLIFFRYGRVECFAIAAIAAMLLIEQAFMTTMFSSGVGLCILLTLIFSRGTLNFSIKSTASE